MYCAYITTLKELRKHSNANRLQCATVFGNNVIVGLDYYEGQRVIYFPVDGQLSEEFATNNNLIRLKDEKGNNVGGYLDPNKRNIKAIRLRGEQSDGLVLPIEVLNEYTDILELKDGEEITILNGNEICRKYIPISKNRVNNSSNKTKQQKEEKKKVEYNFFEEHIDTKQLMYNKDSFRIGDTVYITLKMHGSSGRSSNSFKTITIKRNKLLKKLFKLKDKVKTEYSPVTGSRRVVLKSFDDGFYGNNLFRKKYHDYFASKLSKGIEVFYEIVGWIDDNSTIMSKCNNKKMSDKEFVKKYGDTTIFSYGCEIGQNDMYVYRMTMTNEDGKVIEIPWEQVQIECEKLGIKCVPTFDKFIYTTWEDLLERVMKFYDGTDPIGKTHVREGVVVRIDNREKFTAFKHKNFSFKVLEGLTKESATEPDIEEAQELINEEEIGE